LRFASWNIRSLMGKSIELVKTLHICRQKINITYVQETKWVWAKAREIMGISFGIRDLLKIGIELVFWPIRSSQIKFSR